MSTSHDDQLRAGAASRSIEAEIARLEARLAGSEMWQSLQQLQNRKPGKGLLAKIESARERERLETALAETSEDYRAWVALSQNGRLTAGPPAEPAPQQVFKTRVRVKAASANGAHPAEDAVPRTTPPRAEAPRREKPAADPPTGPVTGGRGRTVVEEASVVIVRRARDGTVTRLTLPGSGASLPPTLRKE